MPELLDKLVLTGTINREQKSVIEIEHALSGQNITALLLQNHFITQHDLNRVSLDKGQATVSVVDFDINVFIADPKAVSLIDEAFARRFGVLPISVNEDRAEFLVAIAAHNDILLRDRIRRHVAEPLKIQYSCAQSADIAVALDRCYGLSLWLSDIINEISLQALDTEPDSVGLANIIVRLVDALLVDAVCQRVSDIHLSPQAPMIQIRFRVDGVLLPSCVLHVRFWNAMVVHIKVLCGMDIAETRCSQDGHLTRLIHGERIDFRVSSLPTIDGENLVIRVLDRRSGVRTLAQLNLSDNVEQRVQRLIQIPQGLLVVCGPTGSGKTTTLYALLQSLESTSLNIMTLEDPVEFSMHNIRQTRVGAGSKIGFADGVRALLRQDPDVLLIGEIRDEDSCAMALRAAMTGHRVLTSVHAPDCVGAIKRLLELGAPAALLAGTLTGVIAQRLVRLSCTACAKSGANFSAPTTRDLSSPLSQSENATEQTCFSCCEHCHGSGFHGRTALMECMEVTPALSGLLSIQASEAELLAEAEQTGMQTIGDAALDLVLQGRTTDTEIYRVIGRPKPASQR